MLVSVLIGFKKKLIADAVVDSECPSCHCKGTVRMLIYQKSSTVFFIPYAPAGKEAVAACSNCDATFIKKTFTPGLKQSFDKLTKRPPLWMYTGAALSVAFLVFVIWAIVHMEQEKERLVAHPEVGTVYDVKLEERRFTLIKVNAIKGDSVYLQYNEFEADDYMGFDQMRDKPYRPELQAVHKNQIKEWYDSGVIRGAQAD